MSYEHNHSIQFDLDHLSQYENVIELDKKKIELDEVYAQAAKADEYEAKAKAWDKLSESIRECNKEIEVKDGLSALVRTSKKGQIVQRHIDCFESGEPYAKK